MEKQSDPRARVIGAMANRRQLGVTFADERMTVLRWEDVVPKGTVFETAPAVSATEDGDVAIGSGPTGFTVSGAIIRAANDPGFASEMGVLPLKRD